MSRSRHILPPRRYWLPEEDRTLAALYPHCRTTDIAAIIGRTIVTVYQHAAKLGLKKSPEFLSSDLSGQLHKHGDCSRGAATRFQKGHAPANKGLRRPGWAPGRMKETQFKKGALNGQAARLHCSVGTILTDHQGYRRIKIRERRPSDPPSWTPLVWPLLHHVIWRKHGRRIPKGKVLVFKDGNRANCEFSNLELITRGELAKRNQMFNSLPRELAEVIQLNGALKRKLRRLQDNAEK